MHLSFLGLLLVPFASGPSSSSCCLPLPLGCLLTKTGLDKEAPESILFLFSLDLKAMIAVVMRFTTMFTLNAWLQFGDQRVGVQLSLASSASLGFSSSSTFSFARASSSFVALAFFLRDS